MVTRHKGQRLWRRVRFAAEVVLELSTLNPERVLRKCQTPMGTDGGSEASEEGCRRGGENIEEEKQRKEGREAGGGEM